MFPRIVPSVSCVRSSDIMLFAMIGIEGLPAYISCRQNTRERPIDFVITSGGVALEGTIPLRDQYKTMLWDVMVAHATDWSWVGSEGSTDQPNKTAGPGPPVRRHLAVRVGVCPLQPPLCACYCTLAPHAPVRSFFA